MFPITTPPEALSDHARAPKLANRSHRRTWGTTPQQRFPQSTALAPGQITPPRTHGRRRINHRASCLSSISTPDQFFATVMVLSPDTDMGASSHDRLVAKHESGLPYDLVALTDVAGPAWFVQVGPVLATLNTSPGRPTSSLACRYATPRMVNGSGEKRPARRTHRTDRRMPLPASPQPAFNDRRPARVRPRPRRPTTAHIHSSTRDVPARETTPRTHPRGGAGRGPRPDEPPGF